MTAKIVHHIGQKDKSQWLCVIGASQSQVPFIAAAHRLGFKTIVFDQNPSAPGAALATKFYAISTHDIDRIYNMCLRLNAELKIEGVVTYSAYTEPLRAVATICDKLSFSSYSVQTVEYATNKLKMKEKFRDFCVPTPKWLATNKLNEAMAFFEECEFPVIMKPSSGTQGSLGISLARNKKEISDLFQAVLKVSQDNAVILERFYKGREFSVDGIINSKRPTILSISEKFNLGPKFNFTMSGFSMGKISENDWELREKINLIAEVALNAVQALDIKNSFFSVDVLLTDSSTLVLECGILLDAKIDRLLNFAGTDIYTMILKIASGQEVKIQEPHYHYGYGLTFMFAEKEGYLQKKVCNKNYQGALIEWEVSDGDLIQNPKSISDTIGWVIAKGSDSEDAYRTVVKISNSKLFQVVEGAK
jgi:biotin carboxylase